MYLIISLVQLFSLISAYNDFPLQFIKEYSNHNLFQSLHYNIIICSKFDFRPLLRTLSDSYHGFISIHHVDEDLHDWVYFDQPQQFVIHLKCPGTIDILHKADQLNLYRKPYNWIILKSSEMKNQNIVGNLTLLQDSDLKIIENTQNNEIFITSAFKISKSDEMTEENLASWTMENGFTFKTMEYPAIRRFGLKGKIIPATLVVTSNDSLNHLEDMVDKHIDSVSKVNYAMIEILGKMLNMSFRYRIDNTWGVVNNGTWTGLVGDLQSGASEIGATALFIRADRLHIMEYYATATPTKCRFIFKSPPLSYSRNIFTLPFHWKVWCCSVGVVTVSSILLYVSMNLGNKEKLKHEIEYEYRNHYSFSDVVILNLGAICTQGAPVDLKEFSTRMIALFSNFSYIFLYVSYSACIVALLQSPDLSIQTLQDLLKSSLTLGADDVVYSKIYFKLQSQDDPIRKAIYERKITPKGEPPHFLHVDEGVRRVKRERFAYHAETSPAYYMILKTFTEEEKCQLQELKAAFLQVGDPWLSFKKHSPYAEMIKIGMKRLLERGIQNREQRRIYTKRPICSSTTSNFVSVGIIDSYRAFIILLYGIAFSIIIAILENIKLRYAKLFI